MLAEPWDVLGFQEHAQDLGRPDGSGQDVMGLGVYEEGMDPAAVLRRTGTAATGAARVVPAGLGGQDFSRRRSSRQPSVKSSS